ncbi:unnamed protein product [Vitrella brassicaformis CCMP3155]|uniref:Ku domain-containing protein n=2 Tax=Vitrella brassicaformis TaxID=1169539 RepID=A0A0G4E8M9_VITBC|nr:unnamed protein product [Vitrella brassicaformis CCMP3155]|eukprot:CEL91867.1 unnamed protein product [Vitrella brassicaformis CCMP3155]
MGQPKEAAVIILDCGRTMAAKLDDQDDTKTHFTLAKDAVIDQLKHKLLLNPKQQLAVVCMGTQETSNSMHDEVEGEGYHNVTTLRYSSNKTGLGDGSVRLVKEVMDQGCEDAESNLLDALFVACDLLSKGNTYLGKKYKKMIFLYTNGLCTFDPAGEEDGIAALLDKMKEMECPLYTIGIGFTGDTDITAGGGSGDGGGGGAAAASAGGTGADDDGHRAKVEGFLQDMANKTDGIVQPSTNVLDNLRLFMKKVKLQRTKYREILQIHPNMKIPVWSYIKCKREPLPTAKKKLKVPTEDGDQVRTDTQYQKVGVGDDEDDADIQLMDIAKGFRFGETTVAVAEHQIENITKYQCDRNMVCIGAVSASDIPSHYLMPPCECVVAEEHNKPAAEALAAVAQALEELRLYLICKYSYCKNAQPKLCILRPEAKRTKKCLYLNPIPYHEDMRTLDFPNLEAMKAPSEAQLNAVDTLIDSMKMTKHTGGEGEDDEEDEEGVKGSDELLRPRDTYNPTNQRFFQALLVRAFDPQAPIPELDEKINSYLRPDTELASAAQPAVDQINGAFTFQKVEAKAVGRKRYWREVLKQKDENVFHADLENLKVEGDDDGMGGQRVPKVEEEDDSEQQLPADKRTKHTISTGQTIKHFNDLLDKAKTDHEVSDVFEAMAFCIEQLIDDREGGGSRRAFEAIEEFRSKSIDKTKPQQFNDLLRKLYGRRSDLVAEIQHKGIALITFEECPGPGAVSLAEAQQHLSASETPAAASAGQQQQDNDDDELMGTIT